MLIEKKDRLAKIDVSGGKKTLTIDIEVGNIALRDALRCHITPEDIAIAIKGALSAFEHKYNKEQGPIIIEDHKTRLKAAALAAELGYAREPDPDAEEFSKKDFLTVVVTSPKSAFGTAPAKS